MINTNLFYLQSDVIDGKNFTNKIETSTEAITYKQIYTNYFFSNYKYSEKIKELMKRDFYGEDLSSKYQTYYKNMKIAVDLIKDYANNDSGNLDMDKLEQCLFPTISGYDVFLSHYHPKEIEEQDRILFLQDYLYRNTKDCGDLKVFVDSDHWSDVNDTIQHLLYLSDITLEGDHYCISEENMRKVLRISHAVYMTLERALQKQMHQSKYFIFIDKYKNNYPEVKAYSPWLALENNVSSYFNEYLTKSN